MKRRSLILLSSLLALVICLALGITAAASGEPTATQELKPQIVSKNVSYASNLHIYYAVPVSTVAEGGVPSMEFYNGNPQSSSVAYVEEDFEVQTISAISGSSEKYYVFRSRGFAAKNIGNDIYAVPVVTVGDTVIRGDALKYSVAEYCYERLYRGGFIDKTKDDGTDYEKRELYLSVLDYGSAAQTVFYINKGKDVKLVNSYTYYSVTGSTLSVTHGYTDTLTGALNLEVKNLTSDNGTAASGWAVKIYRNGVLEDTIRYNSVSQSIQLPAGVSCVISPIISIVDEHLYRLWEIAEQEKIDAVEVEKQWAALEAAILEKYGNEVGLDLVDALKKFYSMYDDKIADWSASIYAKGYMDIEGGQWAGGYYASTGGRDTAGLGPDVQCTEQMLRFISTSGMVDHYGGNVVKAIQADLPWMEYQMVYFTLSLQDDNGYFYHPQWGKEATDARLSRRGRDIGWACSILERFYITPEYETPNGDFPKVGDTRYSEPMSAADYMAWLIEEGLIDEKDVPKSYKDAVSAAASNVTLATTLSTSTVAAVSKVMAADYVQPADSLAHFTSYDGFLYYLTEKVLPKLWTDPYTIGNEIASIDSEFAKASTKLYNQYGVYNSAENDGKYAEYDGLTLKEMMIKGLNSAINPEIGVWGPTPEAGEGTRFLHTNGFMKVMAIYNNWGVTYPYPVQATAALMSGLCSDQASTGNICEVYNIWTALDRLISNINKYYNADNVKETVDGEVPTKESLIDSINATMGQQAAEAVLTSWEKMKGYQKVDGGFSHNYYSGTSSHQGLPVSNGTNVADVDATCIGVTGITREIFTVLGLTSYKPQIFTKSDWMRYCLILDEANPVNKGFAADAEYDFADATIPEDIDVFNGTVTIVDNGGSNAIELSGTKGTSALILKRSDISSFGSVAQIMMDLTFNNTGSYKLAAETYKGSAVSLTLDVSSTVLTVTDDISGTSYSTAYTLGSTINIHLEIGVDIIDDQYVTRAGLFLGGNYCGLIVDNPQADDDVPLVSLTSLTNVRFSQTGASKVVFDNVRFVLTSSTSPSDFEEAPLGDAGNEFSDGGFGLSYKSDGNAIIEVAEEGGNKYLHFDKTLSTDGGANGGGQAHFALVGSSGSGNVMTFETRIRINPYRTNKILKINFKTASGKTPWQIQFEANGRLSLYYSGSPTASETITNDIPLGDWITLTVVIATNSSTTSTTSQLYVNGNLLHTVNGHAIDYAEANTITSFCIVPYMGWCGSIDLDNMSLSFGGEREEAPNSAIPTPAPSITHKLVCQEHTTATRAENVTDATCTANGGYDLVTYCLVCDEIISTEHIVTEATGHSPDEAVRENEKAASCTVTGSYDAVIYCASCGEELSRTTETIPVVPHTPSSPVNENPIAASCTEKGSYESVICCTICGTELSRDTVYTPALDHNYGYKAEGECVRCGEYGRLVGAYDFSDALEGEWTIDGAADVLINQTLLASNYTATFSNTVVVDGDDKYLHMTKTVGASSAAQTIMLFERNTANPVTGDLVFEARIRASWESGKSSYFRFYNGRKADGSSTGTGFGSTSTRNITFQPEGSDIMFAGVDTGVDKGEWFTIRLVLKGTTVTAYIINDDGTARYITAVTRDDWADLSGCTAVAFIQDASTLNTLDVSYAYFGGDKQYVDPRASLTIPEGAFTFDDLENNDWVNGMGNADVVIGTSKQSSAVFTPTIVTDGDNKYFTVTKGGASSGSSMAWVMIKSNVTVSEGETKVFQTKMAFNNTYAKSSVNIRIYNGRTVTNGSNGTELTSNATRPIMTINSAGNVTVGGTATTAKADEWFYLRVVFDSVGATFYMVTEAGICVELCSVAGATADKATTIQFTSQAADMATYTFDYIYFGKAFEN